MIKHQYDLFGLNTHWKVLRYFCLHPSSEMYVNKVASELGLSAGMCSVVLRDLERIGIMSKRELGKAHYYRLVDNPMTRSLKRYIGLTLLDRSHLVQRITERMPDTNSISLYGSFARGDFTEQSDIDILVITNNRFNINLDDIVSEIGHEISVETFSIGGWMKLKNNRDPFYMEVIMNHIVLYGAELP